MWNFKIWSVIISKTKLTLWKWCGVLNASIGYIGQIAKLVLAKYVIFAQLEMTFAVTEKGEIHNE
jgi:hypothetical protein